jgi:N-glycosylase/DNA lyase
MPVQLRSKSNLAKQVTAKAQIQCQGGGVSPKHPISHGGQLGTIATTKDFSLSLCLASGQSFAWKCEEDVWTGAIGNVGFILRQEGTDLFFESSSENNQGAVKILIRYLSLDEDHEKILKTFPDDKFLKQSIEFCSGLRVLKQDPWECLAGFILSSTKQIIHIQQIWKKLCQKWGDPVRIGERGTIIHTFPSADRLARCSETELRSCGMGFRAPYLLCAAQKVASGQLDLELLKKLSLQEARARLMELHGVGRKIADCVLLFSLGHSEAFPVDTWILKVLMKVYFSKKRKVHSKKLIEFTETYFGPYAGYAQQYLFHYVRTNPESVALPKKK